ncbi:MAG: FAD-binding protein [Syntrophomonadaceae bacterium]|nr:FAD-binding protein [Syntrophomonadaceae bacterium]
MQIIEEFRRVAGDIKIIDKPEEKEMYSHDIGDVPSFMTKLLFNTQPSFVVQPKDVTEIKKVLAFANEKKIPVIVRGAASWGFGGVIPTKAGIVVDLSPFRKIIEINPEQKTARVEAGARWSDIDIVAKEQGLSLMTYPSSKFSTVAGWIATGGYSINSFRYGHLSKQIQSMTVVTASGESKTLTPGDEFDYYISTEGVFGIIVEVTLTLRPTPPASFSHLLYYKNAYAAFDFINRFVKERGNISVNVIRFLDENHMSDTNEVMHDNVFKKSPAVLVELSSAEDDQKFITYLSKMTGIDEAPGYVASYLWNERLFGAKAKRLGPSILTSETIIPIQNVAPFIEKAQKMGTAFGVEVCVDSYILDEKRALVMTPYLCDSRKLKYSLNMALVPMLTQTALNFGAEPYGLGIWSASFINHLYSKDKQKELRAYKAKIDPNNIMNPGKFFAIKSKFFNIPAQIFNPFILGISMQVMIFLAPVTGRVVKLIFGKDQKLDRLDAELSTHACAKCGNCIAVCPAYLVTGNEAITARGKLALGKKLLEGKNVTPEEAALAFQCMHCKACEEICQTNLELMMLWDALEKRLEGTYGRPEAQIADFLKNVDQSKEYWEMVDRKG